jgi:hypothetical protein
LDGWLPVDIYVLRHSVEQTPIQPGEICAVQLHLFTILQQGATDDDILKTAKRPRISGSTDSSGRITTRRWVTCRPFPAQPAPGSPWRRWAHETQRIRLGKTYS